MFGEQGSVTGCDNLFSVVVDSDEAVIYEISSNALKLLRNTLMLSQLRAQVQMKTNWVAFKTQRLQELSETELLAMRYRERSLLKI